MSKKNPKLNFLINRVPVRSHRWQALCPTEIDDAGRHPNSPSQHQVCVCAKEPLNQLLSEPIPPFRVHPHLDRPALPTSRRWEHDIRDLVRKPDQLLEDGLGCPVLLSVVPSRNVAIHVAWGSFIISDEKAPWAPSFISSSSDVVHTMLSVVIDKVIRNLMWCRYWHTTALRPQHPQTWHTATSSCWNPCTFSLRRFAKWATLNKLYAHPMNLDNVVQSEQS
jgi:hypothetical protein